MVCATMIHEDDIIKSPTQLDMEEDESEEELSQDDTPCSSSSSSTSSSSNNKRPQALFLNFTSDLSPQKMNKKKAKPKRQTAYRVNGVNILNRNNLDSKTAIERIQRRRENHNHVERRRRDNINNTIYELSSVVPNAAQPGQKPNKGNILKLSLDYIKELQAENNALKERLNSIQPSTSSTAPNSTPNSPNRYINSLSVPSSPLKEDQQQHLPTPPLVLPTPNHPMPPFYIPQPPQFVSRQQNGLRPLLPATNNTPILPSLRMSGYEKIYGNVCRY